MKNIGDKVRFQGQVLGKIVDLVEEHQQIDSGNRIWRLEKIKKENEDKEYLIRVGYYTDDHKSKKKGYIWANRPPTIRPDVLENLLKKAKKNGIIK